LLTIQELSDDFLKLLVKHRIRILDRLQEFIKDDIGFGRKGGRKGFAGFHAPSFEDLVDVEFLRSRDSA
jgi:hypothetical protein